METKHHATRRIVGLSSAGLLLLAAVPLLAPATAADHANCGAPDQNVGNTVLVWTSTSPGDCTGASVQRQNAACLGGQHESVYLPDATSIDGVTVAVFDGVTPCTIAGAWIHYQPLP